MGIFSSVVYLLRYLRTDCDGDRESDLRAKERKAIHNRKRGDSSEVITCEKDNIL